MSKSNFLVSRMASWRARYKIYALATDTSFDSMRAVSTRSWISSMAGMEWGWRLARSWVTSSSTKLVMRSILSCVSGAETGKPTAAKAFCSADLIFAASYSSSAPERFTTYCGFCTVLFAEDWISLNIFPPRVTREQRRIDTKKRRSESSRMPTPCLPSRLPGTTSLRTNNDGFGRSSDLRAFRSARSFFYWLLLPSALEHQCIRTAFVPVYRCGAVPDSHRVPF